MSELECNRTKWQPCSFAHCIGCVAALHRCLGTTAPGPKPAHCRTAVQVKAGHSHSIALTHSGKVYAWGSDKFGQCALSEQVRCSRTVPQRS